MTCTTELVMTALQELISATLQDAYGSDRLCYRDFDLKTDLQPEQTPAVYLEEGQHDLAHEDSHFMAAVTLWGKVKFSESLGDSEPRITPALNELEALLDSILDSLSMLGVVSVTIVYRGARVKFVGEWEGILQYPIGVLYARYGGG